MKGEDSWSSKFGKWLLGILLFIVILVLPIIIELRGGIWNKHVWDYLELLSIPLALLLVGYAYSIRQQATQREQETLRRREAILQGYFDKIANLLLEYGLESFEPGSTSRTVARMMTMTALKRLDGEGRGYALLFLAETKLLNRPKDDDYSDVHPRIHSDGFDFSGAKLVDSFVNRVFMLNTEFKDADLHLTKMNEAKFILCNFSKADLENCEFLEADFTNVNFCGANLIDADFQGAKIENVDFSGSNLKGADFSHAKLTGQVNFVKANLKNTIFNKVEYTKDVKWPESFNPKQAGAIFKVKNE